MLDSATETNHRERFEGGDNALRSISFFNQWHLEPFHYQTCDVQ